MLLLIVFLLSALFLHFLPEGFWHKFHLFKDVNKNWHCYNKIETGFEYLSTSRVRGEEGERAGMRE